MDKKALSLPILISLVIGNMIGTGIYILPASLASFGTISLFSWFYTSLGSLFLALTFAHLSQRFPKTGGLYIYCKEAFGKPTGFVIAYLYWFSYLVSVAGIAVASIGYLGYLIPSLDANSPTYSPYLVLTIELASVWLFTCVNLVGIHTAGVVQLFLTIIKIAPLLLIIIVGLNFLHFNNLAQFKLGAESDFAALSSAAALTFWAFIGLESATVPAENTSGPGDIYKATIYGTLITAIIYIMSTFVLMSMIPVATLKNTQFPFAQAATMLFGLHAASVIAICAVISGLGALNVCILVQGQIVFAAARDHLFPRMFAKLSKKDVPVAGQLLSSLLVTILLTFTLEPTLLKQFDNIALLASLLTLLVYFVATLAEVKFLLQTKSFNYQFIFSKSLIITLLAGAYSLWMISSFNLKILLITGLIICFCIPIYFLTVRKYA